MLNFLLIALLSYIFISLLAIGVNYSNKRKGLEGIDYIDCVNPFKWVSVLYGLLIKLILPPHVFEQYILRFYEPDCQVCIEKGHCIGGTKCGASCGCGCDTVAKMFSPVEQDSAGNWGPIIFNKKHYKKLREAYPVKIKIEYEQV